MLYHKQLNDWLKVFAKNQTIAKVLQHTLTYI